MGSADDSDCYFYRERWEKLPGIYVRRYEGAELIYKYNTLCILDYEDRILAAMKNPFALVILAAKKALLKGKNLDEVLLKEKVAIAKLLIKRGTAKKRQARSYPFCIITYGLRTRKQIVFLRRRLMKK